MSDEERLNQERYWKRTVRRILLLLAIWFIAGPVMGVILAEPLNQISLAGVPLGFYMAQQGAIYIFVLLIFANSWFADRLDREFDLHETDETVKSTSGPLH